MDLTLYSYHRNSAGQRVRIALNLKGIDYRYVSLSDIGWDAYREINPQGLLPALGVGDRIVAQSTAILEFLEAAYPEPPLLPDDPVDAAEVRAFAQLIACEMHPINNNRVRRFLESDMGVSETHVMRWYRHWVALGFESLETTLRARRRNSDFCFGDRPGMADLYLVSQVQNARRFECDLSPYPLIGGIDAACRRLAAFQGALPENQPDFPKGSPVQ